MKLRNNDIEIEHAKINWVTFYSSPDKTHFDLAGMRISGGFMSFGGSDFRIIIAAMLPNSGHGITDLIICFSATQ